MIPRLPRDADHDKKKEYEAEAEKAAYALISVLETLDHKGDLYCLAGRFLVENLTTYENLDQLIVTSLKLGFPSFETKTSEKKEKQGHSTDM